MTQQPTKGVFADKLPRALRFKAWKTVMGGQGFDRYEAYPQKLLGTPESLEEAAQAACDCLSHKESIMVLKIDESLRPERRNLVSIYYVKKRGRRGYIRLPDGTTGREPEFYPDLISQFCVADGFRPIEPWKMSDGNAVGTDLTLIEG